MSKKEGKGWTPKLVLAHLGALIKANDKRYLESFASSKESVATAFAASEKAIRDTLAAVEKSTAAAFVASEKAVALAEANAERWREDAKMWRAAVELQRTEMATKTEVAALKERLDRGEGSRGGSQLSQANLMTYLALAVSIGIAVIMLFKR